MKTKTYSLALLSSITLALALIAVLNYVIDPLLQYRFHANHSPYLNGSQRLLHPGALKFRDYDTVLLGSSMAQYMRPSMVQESLGGKAFNASLAGSSAYEQAKTFDTAIVHGKVKRVIWSVDLFSFSGARLRGAQNLPDYLYDDQHWDDIRYLLNLDTTKRSLKTLLGPKTHTPLDPNFDWDWLSARERRYGRDEVKKAVAAGRFLQNFNPADYDATLLNQNFDEHFYRRIKQQPQIHFEIFFPPYSLLAWIHLRDIGWIDGALTFKRHIVQELLALPNVTIHDFQSDLSIISELDHYLDETHFSAQVSRQLLQRMSAVSDVITTPDQLDLALSSLRQATLSNEIEALLAGQQ